MILTISCLWRQISCIVVLRKDKIKMLWMGYVRRKDHKKVKWKGTFPSSHMTSPNHRNEPTQGLQNTLPTVRNEPTTFRKWHRCSTNSTTTPMKHFTLLWFILSVCSATSPTKYPFIVCVRRIAKYQTNSFDNWERLPCKYGRSTAAV